MTLKQLFSDAELEGIIDRNPSSRLEMPNNLTESSRRPLTEFERSVVCKVAKIHKCGPYVLTMLFCGLRRGECIALTVGDVDFGVPCIYINKALGFPGNAGYVKEPKSKAGVRSVPLPDILFPVLASMCKGRKSNEILFPKSDGDHATEQTCRWWWSSFLNQCHITAGAKLYRNQIQVDTSPFGNEVTAHFLRHTYATDLYAAGVDEMAQRIFLGHASGNVTDTYRKMNATAFSRALSQINEYYSNINFEI